MNDCIFCKIVKGEIPSNTVYEDEYVFAFNDIMPQAPVHVLIVPKKHISSINEINDEKLLGKLFDVVKIIAKRNNLDKDGYRIVSNHGEKAGQSVFHLHIHLLGGRDMKWPPG